MPFGGGKYDDVCTQARAQANAQGALLIVINGRLGSGFSVQADLNTILCLPEVLEEVAKQIRSDRVRIVMPPNSLGN